MRLVRMLLPLIPVLCLHLAAQSDQAQGAPGSAAQSRTEEIEAARRARKASIKPPSRKAEAVSTAEKGVNKGFGYWNGILAGAHGWSLHLGGLAVGSGLAFGPEYIYKQGDLYAPSLIWDSYAAGSFEGYYRLQTGVEKPRLLSDRAVFRAEVVRFDYPRLAYYGPGSDSHKTGRSDYRMQDNYADFRAAYKPFSHVQAGLLGGFQNVKILAGTAPGIASIDSTYTTAEAPGLDERADFLNGGFFLSYDTRDKRGDPRSGTYILTQFQTVDGSRRRLGAFNEYDLDAQRFFAFWNKRRVIATRFKTALTTPKPGTFVPFYLEPRLGGQDDLRGFRPYRFYDQNSVLLQGEYRWTVMEAVELAAFVDGGKVFHNWQEFSLAGLHADAGIGMRVRSNDTVPLRVEVGFSREGFQLWLTFYNVF